MSSEWKETNGKRHLEVTPNMSKRGWRSGLPNSYRVSREKKGEHERYRKAYDEQFPDSIARLGNGAWRWGSDPEDRWREPPAPPAGMTRKEWEQHD